MTRLRKMMLEELQRRNYSQDTTRHYLRTVEDFARRFKCPPDRLGPRHIREYQAELFQKWKLSPGTVTNRLSALRFFYTKTLKKAWSVAETPYPKKQRRIPTILSQEEVARLIDAAGTSVRSCRKSVYPGMQLSRRFGITNSSSDFSGRSIAVLRKGDEITPFSYWHAGWDCELGIFAR
jgi:site-specific recombinase XerD